MTVVKAPPVKTPSAAVPEAAPGGVSFYPNQASGGGIPVMAGQFIPPNGLAGFAQQTPAVQSLYRGRKSSGGRRRKSRTKKVRAAATRKVKRRARKGGAKRLVKGSAAAKRYMAKIRKMRK